MIPPFPTKRVVNNSDPEFLRARQAALENYLDKVARHPRMGTSLDLLVFLDANEAGLEAAKTYIEAVGEEEKASLLERASEAVGGLVSRGGGGESAAGVDTRPTPEFSAAVERHAAFLRILSQATRAGDASNASAASSNLYLGEFAKAAAALGELERKSGKVCDSVRAASAAAERNADSNASVFGLGDSSLGGEGSGSGGGTAPPPPVDQAALAAFSSHSAHAAAEASSGGSISGMFAGDFNDPFSSLATVNTFKEASGGLSELSLSLSLSFVCVCVCACAPPCTHPP